MDEKINKILEYKNLIDNDEKNDFFLFPFMALVLNLTTEKGFISEDGFKLLHNSIDTDFKIINENPEKPSQKAICRVALYFALILNLTKYFIGFIAGLETEEGSKYANLLPADLVEYLRKIGYRVKLYPEIADAHLKSILPVLSDKYAKIFNNEKRRHWSKDIYLEEVVKIPTHPADIPEGFRSDNCIRLNSS
jgi:hypothetical protein